MSIPFSSVPPLPVSTPLVSRCWSGFPCKWRYINVETFNLLTFLLLINLWNNLQYLDTISSYINQTPQKAYPCKRLRESGSFEVYTVKIVQMCNLFAVGKGNDKKEEAQLPQRNSASATLGWLTDRAIYCTLQLLYNYTEWSTKAILRF